MDGIKVYLSWPKNGEPLNETDCKVIDIGYQSRALVVECEEARSAYAALLARAEAAEKERDELHAERDRMRVALEQYADKMNWGFYDMSGCEKWHGRSEDACFLGSDIARAALNGGKND